MHRIPLSFNYSYYSCQDQVSFTWPLSPFYSNTSWPARFELLQADITKEKMPEHTNHKRPQGPVYLLGPCLEARCKLCSCEHSSTCGTCELTGLLLRFSPHLHLQATRHILLLASAHSNLRHLYATSTISVTPSLWNCLLTSESCGLHILSAICYTYTFLSMVHLRDSLHVVGVFLQLPHCRESLRHNGTNIKFLWHSTVHQFLAQPVSQMNLGGGGQSPQIATFAYITHLSDQCVGEHLGHVIHCHYVFCHLRCHCGSWRLFFLGWNWHPFILWNNRVVFPDALLQMCQSQSYPNFYQK
jgi:hypothetical protein